jgi:3-oxoacyl-[acyl-carrier protein] reductase
LAQAGADVVIHYHRNRTLAERLVDEVQSKGVRAIALQAEVTELDSVLFMRDNISHRLGEPDIVVTNAVIQYTWTHILDQQAEDYDGQFRSNVLQNVFMAKAFIPAMQRRKFGRFIGINSECSMLCLPKQSAYVAGKRGADGVLRVLAHEAGEDGVTVNQVAPGWMVSENNPETPSQADYLDYIPLRRRGTDRDVAGVVAFLASDLAAFITGAYIPVCGGHIMPAI